MHRNQKPTNLQAPMHTNLCICATTVAHLAAVTGGWQFNSRLSPPQSVLEPTFKCPAAATAATAAAVAAIAAALAAVDAAALYWPGVAAAECHDKVHDIVCCWNHHVDHESRSSTAAPAAM